MTTFTRKEIDTLFLLRKIPDLKVTETSDGSIVWSDGNTSIVSLLSTGVVKIRESTWCDAMSREAISDYLGARYARASINWDEWLPGSEIDPEWLSRWPVWECQGCRECNRFISIGCPIEINSELEYRPLRFAGQDDDGWLRYNDMKPEYLHRIHRWQYRRANDITRRPCDSYFVSNVPYDEIHPGELWRPAIFAEMPAKEPAEKATTEAPQDGGIVQRMSEMGRTVHVVQDTDKQLRRDYDELSASYTRVCAKLRDAENKANEVEFGAINDIAILRAELDASDAVRKTLTERNSELRFMLDIEQRDTARHCEQKNAAYKELGECRMELSRTTKALDASKATIDSLIAEAKRSTETERRARKLIEKDLENTTKALDASERAGKAVGNLLRETRGQLEAEKRITFELKAERDRVMSWLVTTTNATLALNQVSKEIADYNKARCTNCETGDEE